MSSSITLDRALSRLRTKLATRSMLGSSERRLSCRATTASIPRRAAAATAAPAASPDLLARLLDRDWLLPSPAAELTHVHTERGASFSVLRDDLLSPAGLQTLGGNKVWRGAARRGVCCFVSCYWVRGGRERVRVCRGVCEDVCA